jgi:hypothetical protein
VVWWGRSIPGEEEHSEPVILLYRKARALRQPRTRTSLWR